MTLAHEFVGQGRSTAFIHGFTQTSQSWKSLLPFIRTPLHSQLIDAPGHGLSVDGTRSLWETGSDIIQTMQPGILVGYSMGARMSLHAALLDPTRIEGLVLISGTAGIQDKDARELRLQEDNTLAKHICEVGVATFLSEWLQKPMFNNLSASESDLADRMRNTAEGLSNSLRYAGTGTQNPLWQRLNELHMPVLLIAGALDTKFVDIAQEMHGKISTSTLSVIADAGHSVHLEKPEIVAREIDNWLSQAQKDTDRKHNAKK